MREVLVDSQMCSPVRLIAPSLVESYRQAIYLIHAEWLVYSWDESECTAEENQQIIYFVKGVLAGSPRSSNCLCADDDSDSD